MTKTQIKTDKDKIPQLQQQSQHQPQPQFSLKEFIWIWNYIQNLDFPKHHKIMADWLQDKLFLDGENEKRGLLTAFRNSGKSSIVGLFCSWALLCRPDIRILILAADYELAKKMVRNIKRIIERHPLTKHLKPKDKDQWASDRFTIVRNLELRDASVLARGIGANITGSRADLIICDDVEVPKNCDTECKRQELRAKLSELDFVLTPRGLILYIGTPHTFYTIYRTTGDNPETVPFLKGYQVLKIPIINKNQQAVWPERFPLSKIAKMEAESPKGKFASQMLLKPVNYKGGRLAADRIHFYDNPLDIKESNGTWILSIADKRMYSVSCWWDPAFGKYEKADASVIACVFTSDDGLYRLHDICFIRVDEGLNAEDDLALAQVKQVAAFIKRNFIPAVHIETNGIGKFLPSILKKELRAEKICCGIIEETSSSSKAERIIQAFDAPLAANALYVNTSIMDTVFIRQLREWTPVGYKGHDDGLDAVAGCLLSEPVRTAGINYISDTPQMNWQGSGMIFKAKTDFAF